MPQQILSPAQVQKLLTKLPAGATLEIRKTSRGEIMVNNSQTKDQLIAEQYAPLMGQGISITEAARKYSVPRGAVKGWVYQSNYIQFVDQASYPQLIDEAEVALCADIYRRRKAMGSAGLPYFDERGYLIEEVKRPASTRK